MSVQDGVADLVADLIWKIKWGHIKSGALAPRRVVARRFSGVSGRWDGGGLTGMALTHGLRGEYEGAGLAGSLLVEPIRGAVHFSELPVLL